MHRLSNMAGGYANMMSVARMADEFKRMLQFFDMRDARATKEIVRNGVVGELALTQVKR